MTASTFENQKLRPLGTRATRRAAIGTAALSAAALLGRPAAAQDATPPTGSTFGLAPWAEQLATLDPGESGRMLRDLNPASHFFIDLVTEDVTEAASANSAPQAAEGLVSVIGIGNVHPTSNEFEIGPGAFYVYESAQAARNVLAGLTASSGDGAVEPTSVAGLPGVWGVFDEDFAQLLFVAGPVLVMATDKLFADMARTHLAVSVWNGLANAQHLLRHLFIATREALGVG